MASAYYISAARQRRQRAAFLERDQKERDEAARKIIAKHSPDNDTLSLEQLKSCLEDAAAASNFKVEVTEDEARCIMKMADKNEDGTIGMEEVERALAAWHHYLEHKEKGQDGDFGLFRKFDTDKTGALTRDQLKNFMIDLNDGEAVDEKDVDWLLSKADITGDGTISRLEMLGATSYWSDELLRRRLAANANKKKSKACAIL